MPEIPLFIPHGGSVPRTGHKAAGLIGIGTVLCQRKRPERALTDIYSVGIGVVLGTGRGILEVISSVVLIHPRAFYIWPVGEHASDQRSDISRKMLFRDPARFNKRLVFCFDFLIRSGQSAVVFSDALIADM